MENDSGAEVSATSKSTRDASLHHGSNSYKSQRTNKPRIGNPQGERVKPESKEEASEAPVTITDVMIKTAARRHLTASGRQTWDVR